MIDPRIQTNFKIYFYEILTHKLKIPNFSQNDTEVHLNVCFSIILHFFLSIVHMFLFKLRASGYTNDIDMYKMVTITQN